MDFFPEVLLLALIGGIISADTTASFQIMISQPVVICPIIGLIFSEPQMGLMVGVLLELPWLINIPAGGKHGPTGNLGAVVAAALSIYLKSRALNTENIIIMTCIIYSIAISRIGGYLITLMRHLNIRLSYYADEAASTGNLGKISLANMIGLGHVFILGFGLVGIGYSIGVVILPFVVKLIHPEFDIAFGVAKYGLLGLGIGSIATLYFTQETKWYIIGSFLISLLILLIISI